MKIAIATIMGMFSGALVALFCVSLMPPTDSTRSIFGFLVFLFAWAASSYLLSSGQPSAAMIATRGFLLGAGEWALIIAAGLMRAAQTGAGFIFVRVGLMLFLVLGCLLGAGISYLVSRSGQKQQVR